MPETIRICGYLPPDAVFRGTPSRAPEPPKVFLSIPGEGLSELAMSERGRDHSPTMGFGWGHGGSGPAALAHSILAALCGDQIADIHYQAFKDGVVAHLGTGSFELGVAMVMEFLLIRGVEVVPMGPADPMAIPKARAKQRRKRW